MSSITLSILEADAGLNIVVNVPFMKKRVNMKGINLFMFNRGVFWFLFDKVFC